MPAPRDDPRLTGPEVGPDPRVIGTRSMAGGPGDQGNRPATGGVVVAVVGAIILVVTVGILSLPFGVAAMVLGSLGRRRVRTGRTRQGATLAWAAWWLGLLITVVSVIVLVLLAFGVALLDGLLDLGGEDGELDDAASLLSWLGAWLPGPSLW